MRDTKVAVKSRVNVSPKLAVGVILVCIGAGLGAVAFNALVPTMLTPGSNTVTMAAVTMNPATGWTYVYGDTKKATSDFANLQAAIDNGADVKVVYKTNTASGLEIHEINCDRVKYVTFATPSSNSATCTGSQVETLYSGSPTKAYVREYIYHVMGFNNTASGILKYTYRDSPYPTPPYNYTEIRGSQDRPIKWYVRY